MKKYRLSSVLLVLLFITFLFGVLTVEVLGSATTLDYTFEDNVLYNGEIMNSSINYNLDKIQNNTGIYNGTYTFTDDTDGIIPTDWTDTSTGTCNATVHSDFLNHNKVFKLYDRQNGFHASAYTTFSNQENGFISFWIARDGTDAHGNPMLGLSDATFGINMLATAGVFNLYYGGSVHSSGIVWNEDEWYFIRLDFDCSDNSLNLTINGNLELEGQFQNTVAYINKISIETDNTKDNYDYLVDGILVSWDTNFSSFDNYFPIMENTETDQVKSFEFALNSEGYLNAIDLDNVNSWFDIEDSTINPDSVNCYTSDGYIDRSIRIYQAQSGNAGITKDFNVLDGHIFNISIGLDIEAYGYPDSEIYIDIYSYDITKIYSFRLNGTAYTYGAFDKPADLSYFDGVNWIVVMSDIPIKQNLNQRFDFVWLDSMSGFLRYEYNEVSEQFLIPTLDSSKTGLGNVSIYGINDNAVVYGNLDISIDSVAVNVDGVSKSTEPMNINFDYIPVESWDTSIYNLVELTFNTDYVNNISLWVSDDIHLVEYESTIELQSYIRNVYGEGIVYSPTVSLNSSDTYEVINIKIHGNALVLNDENIYPTYTFNSVDTNSSYFWVDSDNKLQFNLEIDDDNAEYIQASFNIQNVLTENRSVSFKSNIDGNVRGFFTLLYSDTTESIFEVPYYATTTTVILPQTQEVDEFVVLITDNDNSNDGFGVGYIRSVKLIYYPDLATTITSLNLLGIIVPLIVLIAPPMALQKKFGSKIILPMFILMAIICVVTKLIPVWLFFVIAFASIGFIVLKEKVGVEM